MANTTSREIVYALKMRNDALPDIQAFRTALAGIGTTIGQLNTQMSGLTSTTKGAVGSIQNTTTAAAAAISSAAAASNAAITSNIASLQQLQKTAQQASAAAASAVNSAGKAGSTATGGASNTTSPAGAHGAGGGAAGIVGQLVNQFAPGGSGSALGVAATTIGTLGIKALGLATAIGSVVEITETLWSGMERVVEAGDAMTGSLNSLQNTMGQSRSAALGVYTTLEQGAEKTGLNVDELTSSYVRFNIALKGIGASSDDVLKFTQTLTTLAHASGTSGAQANRAFLQLSQGLASGKLQGQDLRAMLEDMPALGQALAQSLGVSIGELREMGTKGTLTPEKVFDAVLKASDSVNKQITDMPLTFAKAKTDMGTAVDALAANIDQKLGLSQLLSGITQGSANAIQSVANTLSNSLDVQLNIAKTRLTAMKNALQTQAASPNGGTGISLGFDSKDVADQQNMVDALQKTKDAQEALSKSQADGNKATYDSEQAHTALDAALEAVGVSHQKVSNEVDALQKVMDGGSAQAAKYGIDLNQVGAVLDALRAKASPLTEELARLNQQFVLASAKAAGGAYGQEITQAMLNADKLDTTGQGANLTPQQRQQIVSGINATHGIEAQSAVSDSAYKVTLAQAQLNDKRVKGGHGNSAATIEAQHAYDDYIKQNGNSPDVVAAAGQIKQNTLTADQLNIQKAAVKSSTAGAKELTNALTEATGKAKEAEDAYNAYMTSGGEASTTAMIAAKAHTEAVKLAGDATGKVVGIEQQLIDAYTREAQAKGNLEVAKDIDSKKQEIAQLQQEISLRGLSAGARERELAVQKASTDLKNKGLLVNPASLKQLQGLTGQAFDLKAANDFQGEVDKTTQGYKDQAATIGLTGDALERQQALAKLSAEAFQKGTPFTDAQKKDVEDSLTAYQGLVSAMQSDPLAGFQAGLQDSLTASKDVFSQMKTLASTAFSGITDDLASMVVTGKASWSDLTSTVLTDITKILINKALISPVETALSGGTSGGGGLLGSIGGLLGFGGSALASGGASPFATAHSGGIAGVNDNNFTASTTAASFSGAKRYHSGGLVGLSSGEVPIIAKRGEAVLPTVRLPDGSMGVQTSGGGGGGGAGGVFAPSVVIQIDNKGNNGTPSDPGGANAMSDKINATVGKMLDSKMTDFLNKQSRPGGMLARR